MLNYKNRIALIVRELAPQTKCRFYLLNVAIDRVIERL